jgi:hypothetical protein
MLLASGTFATAVTVDLLRAQIEAEFLRTTPAKKPRTECCCQWVAP